MTHQTIEAVAKAFWKVPNLLDNDDAMVAAAPDASRPLPTREDIARVLFGVAHWKEPIDRREFIWRFGSDAVPSRQDCLEQADAVLALLSGK